MGSESRQRWKKITVRVTPEEKEAIEQLAETHALSLSSYGRLLMLNYAPKSQVEHLVVDELAALNTQLGRIGGLLKMWLSNKPRNEYGKELHIPQLIDELKKRQSELKQKVTVL